MKRIFVVVSMVLVMLFVSSVSISVSSRDKTSETQEGVVTLGFDDTRHLPTNGPIKTT